MNSLFPNFEPDIVSGPTKWTKSDTARAKADPEFLKEFDLADWPDHAAMIAAAFDWKTFQHKITLGGRGVVSKRVDGHVVRIERSKQITGYSWEIKTTRGAYSVGLHIYQPLGPICRFAQPPLDDCSPAEFCAIHKMFDVALEKLALANIIPREMTSHERMDLVQKQGKSYNEALANFGFEIKL